jgi:hypothetical protein
VKCAKCDKELTRLIDMYGSDPILCQSCWLAGEDEMSEPWYGLGPHEHTFDADGRIVIGGTKALPLPKPEPDGSYKIGGLRFVPDPDAPGCGIWSRA